MKVIRMETEDGQRYATFTVGKWEVYLTGDAMTKNPGNTPRRVDSAEEPVIVIEIRASWRLLPSSRQVQGVSPWWPNPRVLLTFGRASVYDGSCPSADSYEDDELVQEVVDWTSHTAPDWVRQLVKSVVIGPTGALAVIPDAPARPVTECAHDDCPTHGWCVR